MATATLSSAPPRPEFTTVADLQAYLGGIPAYRIRLRPHPGEATEQDIIDIDTHEDRICELIDGILVEKDMASYESILASLLIGYLQVFLEKHDLGVVLGEGGLLRLFPGRVRAPDV